MGLGPKSHKKLHKKKTHEIKVKKKIKIYLGSLTLTSQGPSGANLRGEELNYFYFYFYQW